MEHRELAPAIRDGVAFTPRIIQKKTPTAPLTLKEPGTALMLVPEKPVEAAQFDRRNRYANFHTGVTAYELGRLAQRVNSRLHSGWTGSRAEAQHCNQFNLRPTFAERVV